MPAPSSALGTLRPDLGGSLMEYNIAADLAGFIGHRIYPVIEVAKQAGSFGKIPIEELLKRRTTLRGMNGSYNRGNWKFQPETYATVEHGLEEVVDAREAEMYAEYFDAELVATQIAFDGVLREAEIDIANHLFSETTYTATSVTNEWDDNTNATPIADVNARVQSIWEATGIWPNAIVFNRTVMRNLREVDEVIAKIHSSGAGESVLPGRITIAQLAQAFDLPHVLVADLPYNTANEGQDASISPIWSNEYAWVGRIGETSNFKEPCVGRTFHWGEDGSKIGGMVESYDEKNVRGTMIRVRQDVHVKDLYLATGELLSNITT